MSTQRNETKNSLKIFEKVSELFRFNFISLCGHFKPYTTANGWFDSLAFALISSVTSSPRANYCIRSWKSGTTALAPVRTNANCTAWNSRWLRPALTKPHTVYTHKGAGCGRSTQRTCKACTSERIWQQQDARRDGNANRIWLLATSLSVTASIEEFVVRGGEWMWQKFDPLLPEFRSQVPRQ